MFVTIKFIVVFNLLKADLQAVIFVKSGLDENSIDSE